MEMRAVAHVRSVILQAHPLFMRSFVVTVEAQQADFLPTHNFSYEQVEGVYLIFLTQVKILFSSFVGRAGLWEFMQNIQKYLYMNEI